MEINQSASLAVSSTISIKFITEVKVLLNCDFCSTLCITYYFYGIGSLIGAIGSVRVTIWTVSQYLFFITEAELYYANGGIAHL